MFPKPETRKKEKARKRRQVDAWRKEGREAVIKRDRHSCRACGMPDNDEWTLHMHELLYRSKTGHRPMTERFNSSICLMLCARCHEQVHAKKLVPHVRTDANGFVEFRKS